MNQLLIVMFLIVSIATYHTSVFLGNVGHIEGENRGAGCHDKFVGIRS